MSAFAFAIENVSPLQITLRFPQKIISILPNQTVDLLAEGVDITQISENNVLFYQLEQGRLIRKTIAGKRNFTTEETQNNDTIFSQLESTSSNGKNSSGFAYEDLRVPFNTVDTFGVNPPRLGIFRNNGIPALGGAIQTNSDSYLSIPGDSISLTSFSLEFWINPSTFSGLDDVISDRTGHWEFRFNPSGELRMNIDGTGSFNSFSDIPFNAWSHVIFTLNEDAVGTYTMRFYINGTLDTEETRSFTLSTSTNTITIGRQSGGGRPITAKFDTFRIWNKALSDSEVSTYYNGGDGFPGDGSLDATDGVVVGYDFEEGSGTTTTDYSTNDINGTLTNPEWVDGLPTGGTTGVRSYLFQPNVVEEVFFDVQLPHGRVEGTDLHPHIHWSPVSSGTGNIRIGIEYTGSEINGTFSTTSIIEKTVAVEGVYKHQLTDFGALDGSNFTSSTIIKIRFFRDGTSAEDTYAGDIAVHEFDFHYRAFGIGSPNVVPPFFPEGFFDDIS